MRFALLATASTVLVGFATFACSGSATEEPANGTPASSAANQTSTPAPVPATTTPAVGFGTGVVRA